MRPLFTFLMLISFFCGADHASAKALTEIVRTLAPLTLPYGNHSLRVNDHDVMITKAHASSEDAWGGDGYAVLIRHNSLWQWVRIEGSRAHDVTIWSEPHTNEDAITSITFMIPKGQAPQNAKELYLLETHRTYRESPLDSTVAEFTLYRLTYDADLGIFSIDKEMSEASTMRYCDSDIAALHELAIPLPKAKPDVPCLK